MQLVSNVFRGQTLISFGPMAEIKAYERKCHNPSCLHPINHDSADGWKTGPFSTRVTAAAWPKILWGEVTASEEMA